MRFSRRARPITALRETGVAVSTLMCRAVCPEERPLVMQRRRRSSYARQKGEVSKGLEGIWVLI
jgi:hypothetical protein